ncbi:competence type IV pilus minor pilin ComGD [Bacillus mesophilum]|uniref:Type II secretion system protein n=1 Tax=Bacillus mesophilum TaxID=1071718 RepID=A0A7V7UVZ9_9BACI|nr:competence type IV pilus minor pilin ComGD [Bacillus mesophilum]KAB2333846.1 type II secretion system protein [Bacillus mesophilum]
MKLHTESGFTLIESLIVFSIVLIILTASVVKISPMTYTLLEKQFFSQLKSDLLFAQSYAISHQKQIRVYIQPENHMYYVIENSEEILFSRQYSKDISIQEGSMDLYFSFLSDGNVNQFGQFYIFFNEKSFKMTFLIGRGRFYVAEM